MLQYPQEGDNQNGVSSLAEQRTRRSKGNFDASGKDIALDGPSKSDDRADKLRVLLTEDAESPQEDNEGFLKKVSTVPLISSIILGPIHRYRYYG